MNQPTHGDIQRDLGRMEGKTDAMGARLDRLEKAVADGFDRIDARLAKIEAAESQRSGAFKLGHWLFVAATGLVSFLAAHFWK